VIDEAGLIRFANASAAAALGYGHASDLLGKPSHQTDLQHHPLTASAALVWSGDLPRPLQQMLFDAAESLSADPSLAASAPR
jgi:PAS domain-containing protein